MNIDVTDLRSTIVPKSDQLNAEQLLGGPMVLTVSDVRIGGGEDQPVSVHYHGENGRPYKPCKTMRKVLILAWGPDGRQWVGKSMEVYNDPSVRFGNMDVGGIRIAKLTDIPKDIKVSLTATKGKKAMHEIRRMDSAAAQALASIDAATTVDDLKTAFGAAYKATKVDSLRAQLKQRYDSRLAELSAPKPAADDAAPVDDPAPKTYAMLASEINSATSLETAALVLDGARDTLPADQYEDLAQVFKRREKALST